MKKNEILIITEGNEVIIFHTRKFDIFEKPMRTKKNLEDYVERPREFRSKNDWSYSGEEIAFCFDGNKRLIRVNLV